MAFNVLGIDHRSASVDVRAQFAIANERLALAYLSLCKKQPNLQCVILSTCNRFEIYYWSDKKLNICDWLHQFNQLPTKEQQNHFYHYNDDKAINHAIRVATGLESMVMGEPEIFGQMKKAYARAKDYAPIGPELHLLFQRIFSAAKAIRTNTAVGHCPVSFGCTALRLLTDKPDDFCNATFLLVGAGQTIQLVAKHLKSAGVKRINIVNRTLKRAQIIAKEHDGTAHSFSALPSLLGKSDIVICATNANKPLIAYHEVQKALQVRNNQPMIFLDMGVPRNIDAQIETLNNVTLYCVDDIELLVQHNTLHRTRAAIDAQTFIDKQVLDIAQELMIKDDANTLIKNIRANTEAMANQQLNKALSMLEKGHEPRGIIEQLTRNLTNQWLHQPSTQLNHAAKNANTDFICLAEKLFITQNH